MSCYYKLSLFFGHFLPVDDTFWLLLPHPLLSPSPSFSSLQSPFAGSFPAALWPAEFRQAVHETVGL